MIVQKLKDLISRGGRRKFHVITLFPEACRPYTNSSIIKRAQEDGLIKVDYWQPRDYAANKHDRIDQKPYGGGPGMVLEALPFLRAWEQAGGGKNDTRTIFFSPSGKQFSQTDAIELAESGDNFVFLCGRYEGIDQRVVEATGAETYSVGPYVLTGGELPALTMIDAITRQIPGVLGDSESLEENRTASPTVYTRPEHIRWRGKTYSAPSVLLSGNHAEIDTWRRGLLDTD